MHVSAWKGCSANFAPRGFLEEVFGTYPDRDIRLLAAARGRESSEECREGLTQAMREFL
jgi:hypothetical protein